MAESPGPSGTGWTTHEVVARKDGREGYPYWAALSRGGRIDAQPIIRMLKVQEVGWPEAERNLFFTVGTRRKKRIVRKDDVIWELKCTPNCWRLYFYVAEHAKQIIYVHAIRKNTDADDPRAATDAREQYNRIAGGVYTTRPFRFPRG